MGKILLAFTTLFAAQALALGGPVVESVEKRRYIRADCPVCDGGVEVTETTIVFTQDWCKSGVTSDSYEIKVENKSSMGGSEYKTVTVALKRQEADCFGPAFPKTFQLTTEELVFEERYILTNPSVIK